MEILYIAADRITIRPNVVHAAKSAGRAKAIDYFWFRAHIGTVRWTHVIEVYKVFQIGYPYCAIAMPAEGEYCSHRGQKIGGEL